MNNTMKGLLLLAGVALLAACAARTPRAVDPNAQVPAAQHPAPVKSEVKP
jgi:hypothetical protein